MNFKFCPICSSKNLKQENKDLIKCQNCQFEWYQNPKPAANCICIDKDFRMLLTKRAFEPKKNYWGLPGGFVNTGETLEEATVREIKEELGIEIETERLKYFFSDKDKYLYQEVNYDTVGVVFELKLDDAEISKIKPNDDVLEIQFFTIDKIPWEKLAFTSTLNCLQAYVKKKGINRQDIHSLRNGIDEIDKKILEKLARRKEIVEMIGQYKKIHKLEIHDQKRWLEVEEKIQKLATEQKLDKILVKNIWQIIHTYSKEIEQQV
jgi:ADP-ribose pyrophosphatase YjhB (NUDIX family)/chorismate mutase